MTTGVETIKKQISNIYILIIAGEDYKKKAKSLRAHLSLKGHEGDVGAIHLIPLEGKGEAAKGFREMLVNFGYPVESIETIEYGSDCFRKLIRALTMLALRYENVNHRIFIDISGSDGTTTIAAICASSFTSNMHVYHYLDEETDGIEHLSDRVIELPISKMFFGSKMRDLLNFIDKKKPLTKEKSWYYILSDTKLAMSPQLKNHWLNSLKKWHLINRKGYGNYSNTIIGDIYMEYLYKRTRD